MGNRKVKTPIAIGVPAASNLDDFMLLQVQSTSVHLLGFYIFTFAVIQHSFEILLLHLVVCFVSHSFTAFSRKIITRRLQLFVTVYSVCSYIYCNHVLQYCVIIIQIYDAAISKNSISSE